MPRLLFYRGRAGDSSRIGLEPSGDALSSSTVHIRPFLEEFCKT